MFVANNTQNICRRCCCSWRTIQSVSGVASQRSVFIIGLGGVASNCSCNVTGERLATVAICGPRTIRKRREKKGGLLRLAFTTYKCLKTKGENHAKID